MNVIHSARVLLIRVAKILPFLVCFVALISYAEDIISLSTGNYVEWNEYTILAKPISWWIADIFEYDWTTMVVLVVLTIAVETCLYNKLSCCYLGLNLLEKSYFDFNMEPTIIYIICIANIIVAGWLTYKGIKILMK